MKPIHICMYCQLPADLRTGTVGILPNSGGRRIHWRCHMRLMLDLARMTGPERKTLSGAVAARAVPPLLAFYGYAANAGAPDAAGPTSETPQAPEFEPAAKQHFHGR